MKITIKLKEAKISLNEQVNNTQIKYDLKYITETIKLMSSELKSIIKESKL